MRSSFALLLVASSALAAAGAASCAGTDSLENPGRGGFHRGAAWSPDGKAIAIVDVGALRVLDGDTLDVRRELERRPTSSPAPVGVAWSPSSDEILTAGLASGIEVWRASDLSKLRAFSRSDGTCALALSADGRRALASGYGVATRLWDVASGAVSAELVPAPSRIIAVALSPDGRLAATGDEAGGVRIWELASLRPVAELALGADCRREWRKACPRVDFVAFASDSASVVWNAGESVQQWLFVREAEILAAPKRVTTSFHGNAERSLLTRARCAASPSASRCLLLQGRRPRPVIREASRRSRSPATARALPCWRGTKRARSGLS